MTMPIHLAALARDIEDAQASGQRPQGGCGRVERHEQGMKNRQFDHQQIVDHRKSEERGIEECDQKYSARTESGNGGHDPVPKFDEGVQRSIRDAKKRTSLPDIGGNAPRVTTRKEISPRKQIRELVDRKQNILYKSGFWISAAPALGCPNALKLRRLDAGTCRGLVGG